MDPFHIFTIVIAWLLGITVLTVLLILFFPIKIRAELRYCGSILYRLKFSLFFGAIRGYIENGLIRVSILGLGIVSREFTSDSKAGHGEGQTESTVYYKKMTDVCSKNGGAAEYLPRIMPGISRLRKRLFSALNLEFDSEGRWSAKDPASTGEIYAGLCMLYPFFPCIMKFRPDWMAEGAYIDLNCLLVAHFTPVVVLFIMMPVLFDNELRGFVKALA